jgi:hypothetical protein
MRKLLTVLLLVPLPLFGQTQKAKAPLTDSARIKKLEANRATLEEYVTLLADRINWLTAEVASLKGERLAIGQVLGAQVTINKLFVKAFTDDEAEFDKLAKSYDETVRLMNRNAEAENQNNDKLFGAVRILAGAPAMPVYVSQPAVIPVYLPPPRVSWNCTSNTLGDFTYTRCD